jgi:hypothetical protein
LAEGVTEHFTVTPLIGYDLVAVAFQKAVFLGEDPVFSSRKLIMVVNEHYLHKVFG